VLNKFGQMLAVIVVIMVVGFGLFYRPHSPTTKDSTYGSQTQPADAHVTASLSSTSHQPIIVTDTLSVVTPPVSSSVATILATEHDHHASPQKINVFESLPLETQAEILSFSSKNNEDLVIEQVSANLVRASLVGVHQIVPVAVINDDGSVSIHEF